MTAAQDGDDRERPHGDDEQQRLRVDGGPSGARQLRDQATPREGVAREVDGGVKAQQQVVSPQPGVAPRDDREEHPPEREAVPPAAQKGEQGGRRRQEGRHIGQQPERLGGTLVGARQAVPERGQEAAEQVQPRPDDQEPAREAEPAPQGQQAQAERQERQPAHPPSGRTSPKLTSAPPSAP